MPAGNTFPTTVALLGLNHDIMDRERDVLAGGLGEVGDGLAGRRKPACKQYQRGRE